MADAAQSAQDERLKKEGVGARLIKRPELGAIAGVLVAPQLFISPGMLDFVLVYALAAAILGGLDSPIGAVVAAAFIGVVENLAGAYVDFIGDDLKIAVPFVAVIVILIVRPQGLFGRKVTVRV